MKVFVSAKAKAEDRARMTKGKIAILFKGNSFQQRPRSLSEAG
jgi:hypothetical protein